MLHRFTMNGDYLVYDSETQALLSLDPLAYETVGLFDPYTGQVTDEKAIADLKKQYPDWASSIDEIIEEISLLKDQDVLFRAATPVTYEQLYPDDAHIKSMCLHICHDCNLRCRYCFAGQGDYHMGERSMLTSEVGRQAIDFLIEVSGPRHNLDIDFFGGEPLMNWPVVEDLVAYAEKRGEETGKDLRLTMTTNALLLDKDKRDFINKHFKNVVLSMDGRPEVHDHMRPAPNGKSSFDPVMQNIKAMVEERGDQEFYVRGTYTKENLDFAEDVKYMAEQDLRQLSIEPVVAEDTMPYALSEEDLPVLEQQYEDLARYYVEEKDGDHPFRFFHFLLDLDEGPCAYKRLKGCGVGTEYIAVTPTGDIYPCHQFVGEENFRMGNVADGPEGLNPDLVKVFQDRLLPHQTECDSCWAKYFCTGGCLANHYHATGSMDELYGLGCALQKKRLEAALWIKYREKENEDQSRQVEF